ncbi:MAG: hypothetical protein PHO02_01150 [Candidatus Nanoarchaeia archaeon]|nr:hypothetical protein [Candidatus Nanoarchaeia archaeon]
MDFEDLYFKLERVLDEGEISIPIMPDFNLDNVVEGSFYLAAKPRQKQEFVKRMVQDYIAGQKNNGNDIMLVVLLPHSEKGDYDSPVSVKTERMFYDSFPENLEGAIVYCIARNVFDSLYGKTVTKSGETASC